MPVHHRGGQLAAVAPVGDRTVPQLKVAIGLDLISSGAVPDIGNAEVILLGPEKWNRIKSLSAAHVILRIRFSLAFGNDEIFDPDSLAQERTWPARDVARRENTRGNRSQVFVDRNPATHGKTDATTPGIPGAWLLLSIRTSASCPTSWKALLWTTLRKQP